MKREFLRFISLTFMTLVICQSVLSQTTAFTYQGSLQNGGIPANGNYDFEFGLFSVVSGGTQMGTTFPTSNVVVANGVFTVSLDFGSQFPGANRFLEIRVRQTGGGAFTTLAPRQSLTSSPYAIQSRNANEATNALNATTATNATQLGGIAPSGYIQNTSTQQSSTNFNIGGTGTANILNAATQFNIGGSRVFGVFGTRNVFAGVNAGTATPSGFATDNSFFGSSAGQTNNLGGRNSFFGSGAGQANSDGGENSFFGAEAGQANSTGGANSFFGNSSGKLNSTGSANSFFGSTSGDANTIGSENSFFGGAAGGANTTGIQNAFFGRSAGFLNVSGNNNAFFGFEAGRANTANNNSFFGSQAGAANTTGSGNSMFGLQAGFENTTGTDNAFFGVNSGRANSEGNRNTFYGRLSGRFNTTGNDNTFIGYNAASSNVTGSNNVAIGANANVANGINNAVVIGAGASVAESNQIVIGSSSQNVKIAGEVDMSEGLLVQRLTADFVRFSTSGNVLYSFLPSVGINAVCWQPDVLGGAVLGKCGSSIRYKTNINGLERGIDLIKRLRPVTFDLKSNGMTAIGLIAEEVNEVEPLLSIIGKDNVVDGVRYDSVTAVLVNAVKEQQTQIETQQQQIDVQSETIRRQQARLAEQDERLQKQQTEIEALKQLFCAINPEAKSCMKQEENK